MEGEKKDKGTGREFIGDSVGKKNFRIETKDWK